VNHHGGDKKGRPKKDQKTNNMQELKERERELFLLKVGSYLHQSLSNVTCMQIVKHNNN
jgi:hypothetical protein